MPANIAGVALAAGLGTRLRPLTTIRPKALCPVANVALVDWALDRLSAVTDDVAVNAHHLRGQLIEHLRDRQVEVSLEEDGPLGTAGALGRLRDWIDGRPTLVINADTWHPAALTPLVEGWSGDRVRMLVVDEGAPADFDNWRYAGASLLPWSVVRTLEPVTSGLSETAWRVDDAGDLDLMPSPRPWFDCGTPASYLAANLAASGGESVVGPNARVEGEVIRSVVWDGASVQAGERLVDCIRATDDITVQT